MTPRWPTGSGVPIFEYPAFISSALTRERAEFGHSDDGSSWTIILREIAVKSVLEQAKDSRAVRMNASELMSCLSWSRPRPGFAGNKEEHETILRLPGVAMALWTASTAQRVHYRFQQRLIEMRSAVLKIGINEDQLPIPAWLTERIDELRGSGPSATPATNMSV